MAQTTEEMLAGNKLFSDASKEGRVHHYSGYSIIETVAEHLRMISHEPDFKPDNSELLRKLKARNG